MLISGEAVSIRSGTDTTTHTTVWQNITAGTYDTGRGLKITFADPATYDDSDQGVAGEVTYTAQGTKITVTSTMTLADIASQINSAKYADGNEVLASIVDRRLILTAKYTGREMLVSETSATPDTNNVLRKLDLLSGDDSATGTFSTFLDATVPQTAQFKVNGLTLERKSNTGLTSVIAGVTLNLTGVHTDWTTQSDKITVTENMDGANKAITDFLTKLNEMLIFLDENTGVTKIAENQYTRGGLADDTIFSDLRSQLFSLFSAQHSTTYQRANRPDGGAGDLITLGAYKSLREIGIGLDDNLTPTVLDQDKLNTALTNNLDDVKKLFDAVMGSIDDLLGRFTGVWGDYGSSTTGYITTANTNIDNEIKQLNYDIKDENQSLSDKQASLVQQYAQLQSQLLSLQYMQQSWSSIDGGMSRIF
jgi:flagellar capping protein FliD